MLSYTFSRREKTLLVVLAIILVCLAWYLLVYRATSEQLTHLDSQIATAQAASDTATAKLASMTQMQNAIAEYKAAGVKQVTLPDYDNTTHLMAELNAVLSGTSDYTLSFDDLDWDAGGIVKRGVTISFGCNSYDDARAVMDALEHSSFACSIDSASMVSTGERSITGNGIVGVNTSRNTTAPVSVGLHAVYFEKA